MSKGLVCIYIDKETEKTGLIRFYKFTIWQTLHQDLSRY